MYYDYKTLRYNMLIIKSVFIETTFNILIFSWKIDYWSEFEICYLFKLGLQINHLLVITYCFISKH